MKNMKAGRNKLLTKTGTILPKFSTDACSDMTVHSGWYDSNPHLTRGNIVLIPHNSERIIGKFTKLSDSKLSLEFYQSLPPPFPVGEKAKIRYWDESHRCHWWKAEVVSTSFYGRQMEVSILEKGMESRQFFRLHKAIPFFFTVTQDNQTRLIGWVINWD